MPRYQLKLVLEYINANLQQNIKLQDLANVAGMSQYYFCRLFRDSIGMTPHQYVRHQRIERAKQLLKQQHLSISDIAIQCGFANQSHFTRLFSKFTHTTPKLYRDSQA
ncbi:helix-turn-helix transcriptional regulator [Oscillatoria sp. FACHB-1407]